VNKKQFVVIGLKERVIHVVIFGTYITWMISTREGLAKMLTHFQTIVQLFNNQTREIEHDTLFNNQTREIEHDICGC
jgi:hypothetical protein